MTENKADKIKIDKVLSTSLKIVVTFSAAKYGGVIIQHKTFLRNISCTYQLTCRTVLAVSILDNVAENVP